MSNPAETLSAVDPVAKPMCLREHALAVVNRLRENGHVAYFAGGCVRDELLGLTPKDYDVATDAEPSRVRQLFHNTQSVGAAFGVILVRQQGSVVEVATFRSDLEYVDGRRPAGVVFTTAEQDAQRRDFTINGLFLDPVSNQVIDFVGGRADLEARRLRAIGEPEQRFNEDHLRLLRAVRFASRFNLSIEPRTAEQVRLHAPKLRRISPERIADELRRMLTPPLVRDRAWRLLWDFALIDEVMRFLPGTSAEGVDFDPTRSPFLTLAPNQPVPFGLALAAGIVCFRAQGGTLTPTRTEFLDRRDVLVANHAMRQALRISNDESERLIGVLTGAGTLLNFVNPTLAARKRFVARPAWRDAVELVRAMVASGLTSFPLESMEADLLALSTQDFNPPPLVTGDDLTDMGLRPGPIFRRILEQVYDAQLEGTLTSRTAALELARSISGSK